MEFLILKGGFDHWIGLHYWQFLIISFSWDAFRILIQKIDETTDDRRQISWGIRVEFVREKPVWYVEHISRWSLFHSIPYNLFNLHCYAITFFHIFCFFFIPFWSSHGFLYSFLFFNLVLPCSFRLFVTLVGFRLKFLLGLVESVCFDQFFFYVLKFIHT